MDENILIFDDWAMYLTEQWRDIHEELESKKKLFDYYEIVKLRAIKMMIDKDSHLSTLLIYLGTLLEFDVPRNRHGYQTYIPLDKEHQEVVRVLVPQLRANPRRYVRVFLDNPEEKQKIEAHLLKHSS